MARPRGPSPRGKEPPPHTICSTARAGPCAAGTIKERELPAEIERIRAFERAIDERSATSIEPFRWGRALFNTDFPRSWAHNFLRVEGAPRDVTVPELAAEAERLHSAAGHDHRSVTVDDEAVAGRLLEGFERARWNVDRLVAMVHRREPDRRADAVDVREVDFETVRPALAEFYRRSPYGDSEETVRQLVERNLLTARATDVRHFAVVVDGSVVSACDLYSDGRTAQIEDVNTLEDFRGRGFARATVLRALDEARATGHDLVFLVADDDDWPKHFYAKLGFEAVGCSHGFVRPPGGGTEAEGGSR